MPGCDSSVRVRCDAEPIKAIRRVHQENYGVNRVAR